MDKTGTDGRDVYRVLAEHADHLNAIRRRRQFAEPFYEILSGALIWPDETNERTPTELIGVLRIIWAYRTSLMLGRPREKLEAYWRFGLEKFPCWVGFSIDRREPTPKLLAIYRRGEVRMRKCLRDMDRR